MVEHLTFNQTVVGSNLATLKSNRPNHTEHLNLQYAKNQSVRRTESLFTSTF